MAAKPAAAEGAIIVPVELPVAIRRLRDRLDPAAALGLPPHITLLFPFVPPENLDEQAVRTLQQVVSARGSFSFELATVGRWPEVVYLAPKPDEPFRALSQALIEAFPEYPPYGGAHDEVVPHLTVAQDPRPEWLAAAEHALPQMLPVRAVAREVLLLGHQPDRPWQTHLHLPFEGLAER